MINVLQNKVMNMRNVYNFNAGPAMLPEEVLLQAQAEMLDWNETGMSIMELGHRGSEFHTVAEKAEVDLRELMSIPKHYHVFFLAGGATTQFAMVPLNLFGDLNKNKNKADYIETGIWSKKAIAEANRYGMINVAAQTAHRDHLAYIPPQHEWQLTKDAAYLHYTPNETIDGIEFQWVPKIGDVPLVADMTSMILSRPINVNDYGIIYAGAQKNLGQAGLTVVIIREDLIKDPLPMTPTL
jgi:phosphoserine aminotransferase